MNGKEIGKGRPIEGGDPVSKPWVTGEITKRNAPKRVKKTDKIRDKIIGGSTSSSSSAPKVRSVEQTLSRSQEKPPTLSKENAIKSVRKLSGAGSNDDRSTSIDGLTKSSDSESLEKLPAGDPSSSSESISTEEVSTDEGNSSISQSTIQEASSESSGTTSLINTPEKINNSKDLLRQYLSIRQLENQLYALNEKIASLKQEKGDENVIKKLAEVHEAKKKELVEKRKAYDNELKTNYPSLNKSLLNISVGAFDTFAKFLNGTLKDDPINKVNSKDLSDAFIAQLEKDVAITKAVYQMTPNQDWINKSTDHLFTEALKPLLFSIKDAGELQITDKKIAKSKNKLEKSLEKSEAKESLGKGKPNESIKLEHQLEILRAVALFMTMAEQFKKSKSLQLVHDLIQKDFIAGLEKESEKYIWRLEKEVEVDEIKEVMLLFVGIPDLDAKSRQAAGEKIELVVKLPADMTLFETIKNWKNTLYDETYSSLSSSGS